MNLRAERWRTLRLIALGVALLALVVFAKVPKSTLLAYQLHKFGHPTVFALVALIIVRLSSSHHYVRALIGVLLAGAVTELAQIPLQRGASFEDIGRDLIGATAALSVYWLWTQRRSTDAAIRRRRVLVGAVAIVFVSLACGPLAWCIAAYVQRGAQMPVLAEFESPWGTYFLMDDRRAVVRERMPARWLGAGPAHMLHGLPGRNPSIGMGFNDLYPDWNGYDSLGVDVTNPGDGPLYLIVRVHDRLHDWDEDDRFNGKIEVPAQTRRVFHIPLQSIRTAPRTRETNMSRISGIAVFTAPESRGKEFLLSRLWLEPPPAAR